MLRLNRSVQNRKRSRPDRFPFVILHPPFFIRHRVPELTTLKYGVAFRQERQMKNNEKYQMTNGK
jgi:hypothetical protein